MQWERNETKNTFLKDGRMWEPLAFEGDFWPPQVHHGMHAHESTHGNAYPHTNTYMLYKTYRDKIIIIILKDEKYSWVQ